LPENEDSFSVFRALGFAFGMLFSFQGRIGRAEFWSIGIINFVILIAAVIAYGSTVQPVNGEQESLTFARGLVSSMGGFMFLVLYLALTVNNFSLTVRRMHDRDVSGFWLLILFIPIIGSLYGLWLFIANGFFAGTPGHNRFDTGHSQAAVFD